MRIRRANCELCKKKPQLPSESQALYEAWLSNHQQSPDELQVIEQLLDLDEFLLEFVAPAFSPIGAPARRVGQLLRALLLLNIKNVRSEKFLVDTDLKHNLLYRWFVRLEKDEVINDSFRIALVRLRARLAFSLGHDHWQSFLAKTVEQAIAQARLLLPVTEPPAAQALATVTSEISSELVNFSSALEPPPEDSARPRPDTGPPKVEQVTFDLTPVKARARILDKRDLPKAAEQKQTPADKLPAPKSTSKKTAAKKKILPRSQGDPDAYWISKNRRTTAGRTKETTLGFETGFFSTQSQGIITGVVVRKDSQANRTEFPNWVDQYAKDWILGDGQLSLSADGEFQTGETLKHFENRKWRLDIPVCEPTVAKGKLDHRYFTYLATEDIFVCHEGAELKRIGHDKHKQRTRYRAPAEACANCPTANLCKGGEGPRKVSRSDFAQQFARAKEQTKTDQHRDARWAQHVNGEGSFAHSNCNHGLDHARYYGQKRMIFQATFTAAAMNLKKAFRFFQARLSGNLASMDPAPA